MNLRPYQLDGVAATEREWRAGRKRTLMVMPTGTGKTIIFASLAARAVEQGGNVLILAHRDELIRQAQDKLERATGLGAAIEKAGECAAGCMERVVIGSVQTLLNPTRRDALTPPTHIIVDEAHHVLAESYLSVLNHWPDADVLGVTATPDRGDMRDLGAFFESLAFEYTLPQAVAQGYLSKIKALTIPLRLDMTAVKTQAGDLQAAGVGVALEPYLPQIAAELAEHCRDRKTLIFTPLCATAKTVQAYLEAAGLPCFYASGEDRSQIPAWEAHGPGCAMINAMLLTEGYDHPAIDAVCVLRCTRVRSLYAQMVGRGTRPLPGKDHLLLVDFLWMSQRHDLCRPAHLVAEDDAVARKMVEKAESAAGGEMDLDAEALAAARQDVVEEREAALAKKLAEMRNKKRQLVDPLQYAMSVGAADLLDFKPALPTEAKAPTPDQIEALGQAGLYPGDVTSAGHAEKLLQALQARKEGGYATPRQVRCLERYGFARAGQMEYKLAQRMIGRIAANGWRLPDDLTTQGEPTR